ncbi:MAG TPA: cytochrome c oxidase subunit II [Abditibacterium sp.]|jgi:cytochrome c oxidase subunit 2
MIQQLLDLFPFIPPQASSIAGGIDGVFWVITAICIAFMIGVGIFLLTFTIRYRQGSKVNRVLPHHEGIALEMIWTVIPLVIALGLFLYSTVVYFQTVRAPKDSTEIFVVGKQWMWKMQHPNGRWEMNELHVPVGKPVKLTMISEDVIHDFGIPAFRLNMDVVPGKYTQMWFNPTRVGRYHIFCAQYCGTNHAIMGGYITVMEPDQFEKWSNTGNVSTTLASTGEKLFRDNGCTGCHGPNANVRAPSLVGIYGKDRPVQIAENGPWNADLPATTVKADYRYLHDAIMLPAKEIAAGYKPIMPSYQGRLSEEQVIQLIDYIKSLNTSNGTSNGSASGYQPLPGQETGGGGMGGSAAGDSRTGRDDYVGNPSGDMANRIDRDAIYRAPFETRGDSVSGREGQGNPTGDMSNQRDRETIFRGGGAASDQATLDRSAGGMRKDDNRRGGLNPYKTDNYANSAVPIYSGGLRPQAQGGGSSARMQKRGNSPASPMRNSASPSNRNSGTRPNAISAPQPGASNPNTPLNKTPIGGNR